MHQSHQKQSFFNCLLDMAAMEKSSRAGSLSIDGANPEAVNSQTHLLHAHHHAAGNHEDRPSLQELARRNTLRNRSMR